jgi:phage protein D
MDQNESDMAFLKRLASIYAAVFKVYQDYQVFVKKGKGMAASGKLLTERHG